MKKIEHDGRTVSQHISLLWRELERHETSDHDTLIGLPYPYIVPGGIFDEQFYWDSYFIMLGLAADNRWDMIENMIGNFAFMLKKFGKIPNANRTFFLSRSQPPFFALMVRLLASHKGDKVYAEYLPSMLLERRFWMEGRSKLRNTDHLSYLRIAQMPSGVLLNRYYDENKIERPEFPGHDDELARMSKRTKDRLFLHVRAATESGWDFSSRWCYEPKELGTIHAADIIPIDLNCLLYELDTTISKAYTVLDQPVTARQFLHAAEHRASAIQKYCWDATHKFFVDYNFHRREQSQALTLAGVFPLYSRIATSEQAKAVAERIEKEFLDVGGLKTTCVETNEQWDAPNGWAPLQWMAIKGLRNYGYHSLAREIKQRWIKTNMKLYQQEGVLVEKYNVSRLGQAGSGGEYPLQEGFGWTNGVLAALLAEK